MTARLLREDVSQQQSKPRNSWRKNLALASFTQKGYKRKKNVEGNEEGYRYCGKPGHTKADCLKRKRDKVENDASKVTPHKAMVALVKGDTFSMEWALTS